MDDDTRIRDDALAREHLVVPLDGSPLSERALLVALVLAERLGVTCDLISVIADDDARADRLRGRLAALANEAGPVVTATHVTTDVDPVLPITALVARFERPVLCLASHGRERTAGVLVESVATELLRVTSAPVVMVGPHACAPPAGAPVVLCVDGWPESERAVPVAGEWARRLGVPLVVTIVVKPSQGRPGPRHRLPDHAPPFDADEYVRSIARDRTATGNDARAHVIRYTGHPAEALGIYIEEHAAQLVVVASRARAGVAHVALGSVAARFVHDLLVPVLVVGPNVASEGGALPIDRDEVESIAAFPTHAPFGTVVVPVDVDHAHGEEIGVARCLATMAGAAIALVAVPARDDDERTAQAALTDLADAFRPLSVQTRVRHSPDPAQAILLAAPSYPASVVCLATHAPGMLTESLVPTITGAVVRWSKVPVVLVGPRCREPSDGYVEAAAFVDGSEISEEVVGLAGRWSRDLGLALTVIEVVHPAARSGGAESIHDEFVRRLASEAERSFGITVDATTIVSASTAPAIVDWTRRHPEALVVVGSHGRGLSEHALGAVVMDVSRHSVVPVVVLPAHTR